MYIYKYIRRCVNTRYGYTKQFNETVTRYTVRRTSVRRRHDSLHSPLRLSVSRLRVSSKRFV